MFDFAKKKHKYVAKIKRKAASIGKKDTWRYFYTKEEYQAYLNGKKKIEKKVSNIFGNSKKLANNIFNRTSKTANKNFDKFSRKISKTAKTANKNFDKFSRNAYKAAKNVSKDISKDIYKSAKEANKNFDKFSRNAYKAAKNVSKDISKDIYKSAKEAKKNVDKFSRNTYKAAKNVSKDISKDIYKSAKEAKKYVDKSSKEAKKYVDKLSKDIYKSAKEAKGDINKLSKDISKTVKEVKKNVEDTMEKASTKIEKKLDKSVGDIEKLTKKGIKEVAKTMDEVGRKRVNVLEVVKDRMMYIGEIETSNILSKFMNDKKRNSIMNKLYQMTQPIKDFKDLKAKKKKNESDEDDMLQVNQNYETNRYEYTNNCAYCTMAYEMRQRGYDVEANPATARTNNTIDTILDWYDGEEAYSIPVSDLGVEISTEGIENHIKKYGEGSRGQFITYWSGGGAHSVAWEVVDNDVVLRDCQTKKTLDVVDYVQYSSDVVFFRTDNLELTKDALKCVRNK